MKRPLFFWTHSVVLSYASLHVAPPDLKQVVSCSKERIRKFPFKYYVACQISLFLIEFIMPAWHGYFSRFSKLSQKNALMFLETFQNTKHLLGRLMISLCKIPIMISMKNSNES